MARVYPRACGETSDATILFKDFQGLSPRMRGNQRDEERDPQ